MYSLNLEEWFLTWKIVYFLPVMKGSLAAGTEQGSLIQKKTPFNNNNLTTLMYQLNMKVSEICTFLFSMKWLKS